MTTGIGMAGVIGVQLVVVSVSKIPIPKPLPD